MRLPFDVCRCYGKEGSAVCPARATCARFLALTDCGYTTPHALHLCDTRGQSFMQFYIKQEAADGGQENHPR